MTVTLMWRCERPFISSVSTPPQNLALALQRLVPNACEELFASIGCRAKAAKTGDVTRILARPREFAGAVIEFDGEAVSARAVIVGPFAFFAASRPNMDPGAVLSAGSARDWIRVRDWTMELANQLVGRIKNRLCTLGVAVESRLPTAVSDHALLVTVRERTGPHLLYTAGGHEIFVWFEASIHDGAARTSLGEPLSEGDVVTF